MHIRKRVNVNVVRSLGDLCYRTAGEWLDDPIALEVMSERKGKAWGALSVRIKFVIA
jgi:hypothetical protein